MLEETSFGKLWQSGSMKSILEKKWAAEISSETPRLICAVLYTTRIYRGGDIGRKIERGADIH